MDSDFSFEYILTIVIVTMYGSTVAFNMYKHLEGSGVPTKVN